jgi:hypothetical protein
MVRKQKTTTKMTEKMGFECLTHENKRKQKRKQKEK